MKRLIIIAEGDTELEFATRLLAPELRSKGIYSLDCFKIKHSKGGLSDIEQSQNRSFNNFMPYIQLHEFEALIFSSGEIVSSLFDSCEFDIQKLRKLVVPIPYSTILNLPSLINLIHH